MKVAATPWNEVERIAALQALDVLDTAPESEFDALVNAAAAVCDAPISLVSLVDTDRQWFKANHGLAGATQTPRDIAFCAHAILQDGVFEVPDAGLDYRFADNPLVSGAPDIRFYAGAPVRLSNGQCVGTLCVIDREPRVLNERQREVLQCLAKATAQALEGRIALKQVRGLVGDLSRAAEEAQHRASHDPLTGLLNRASFGLCLKKALNAAATDSNEPAALLCIDLDHFKLVNDTCGHAAGDLLLQQITDMLRRAVRKGDAVARLGGDEFAILLNACTLPTAQRLAEGICATFDNFRFVHGDHRMKVGTSIGLVAVDGRWAETATLMQAADACCYSAKQAGRNRVVVLSENETEILERTGDSQWAARIEQALDGDKFVLFGQRIAALRAGDTDAKLELLLRMIDIDGSLISPGAFLPSAERYHLMGRVDRWVVCHAIDWLSGLLASGAAPSVAINLSGQSVSDRSFQRWAVERFAAAGAAVCARVVLEITETAAITNLADAAHFMGQARALGMRTALDDFGAGSSSFGYLKQLPLDYLKIDGQFVRDVLTDPLDAAAVRCFVDVARVVGLQTVAEFVESEDVLRHLSEMGVDMVQGFHIHRPAPLPSSWPEAEAEATSELAVMLAAPVHV
jgi:diguanylate cyclase (GGDEF)-like protein